MSAIDLPRGPSLEHGLVSLLRLSGLALLLAAPLSAQQKSPGGTTKRHWADDLMENLRPHRKNYILVLSHDSDLSDQPSSEPDGENRDAEVKFQLSLKYELTDEARGRPGQLFFAYTSLSHWQVYDTEGSSPFRTTDHEPELYWEWYPKGSAGMRCGVAHQSNGEGGAESRSWNRVYVEALWNGVERWDDRIPNEWGLACKVWQAFDVSDNNDDIEDYLGNFELRSDWHMPWDAGHAQLLSLLARRNFEEDRGSFEVNYSRDFIGRSRLLFQYFGGYGESLLDYNEYAHRVSIGFEFSP